MGLGEAPALPRHGMWRETQGGQGGLTYLRMRCHRSLGKTGLVRQEQGVLRAEGAGVQGLSDVLGSGRRQGQSQDRHSGWEWNEDPVGVPGPQVPPPVSHSPGNLWQCTHSAINTARMGSSRSPSTQGTRMASSICRGARSRPAAPPGPSRAEPRPDKDEVRTG